MTYNPSRRLVLGGMFAAGAATVLPFRLDAKETKGEIVRKTIQIDAADGKFDAYVAAPASGKGPAVIVVTHIFGVDQDTKDYCDQLASRGCVAVAQNFFWRDQDSGVVPPPKTPGMDDPNTKRAIGRAMRIDFPKSMDDLKRAVAVAKGHPNSNGKTAVLGYCFGGPYAWRAACDGFGVDAAVSFHGTFVSKYMKPGDKPSCPVEFHYGDQDVLAPPPELEAVKKVADATGSKFVIHPGAHHAYMMPTNGHYHEQAAKGSWASAVKLIDTLSA